MSNLIQIADMLKGMPDQYLQQEAQQPSGVAPPFMVLSEIQRRKALRVPMTQAPTSTVYEDLIASGGQPPQQGMPGAPMRGIDALGGPPGPPQGMPGGPPPDQQGLGAMASQLPPTMQQAAQPVPPSMNPMRMSGGGVVRMYEGGPTRFFSAADAARVAARAHQSPLGQNPDEENYYQALLGLLDRQQEYTPYEYKAPTPYEFKEPDLGAILGEVRKLRSASPTEGLEQRIRELEEERKNVRRPGLGDMLFETGLGMMASPSPYAAQSLGAGALSAFKNYENRQYDADQRSAGMADRLATLRQAAAQSQLGQETKELDLANSIAQRLHGSDIVKAQTQGSLDVAQENARRASYEAEQRWKLGTLGTEADVLKAFKPREIPYSYTKEGIDAAEDIYRRRRKIMVDNPLPKTPTTKFGSAEADFAMTSPQLWAQANALIHDQLTGTDPTGKPYVPSTKWVPSDPKDPKSPKVEKKLQDKDRYAIAVEFAIKNAGNAEYFKDWTPTKRAAILNMLRHPPSAQQLKDAGLSNSVLEYLKRQMEQNNMPDSNNPFSGTIPRANDDDEGVDYDYMIQP